VALKKEIKSSNIHAIDYQPPEETKQKVYLEDILEKSVDNNMIIKRDDITISKKENEIDYTLKPVRVGVLNKGGQGERIYSPKGHAITQSAYGGGVGARTGLYNTPQGVRRLTINECKRVMGFPVDYKVSNGIQGYKQLGNAVIPDMISYVYENIKAS
jgi:DNA (cytosine-5)-methyltransferase 1